MKVDQIQLDEDVVQEISIPQKTGTKLLGRYRRRIKNGKIFVYHHASRTLGLAKVDKTETLNLFEGGNERIDMMADCAYIEAINLENAKRKLLKGNFIFVT